MIKLRSICDCISKLNGILVYYLSQKSTMSFTSKTSTTLARTRLMRFTAHVKRDCGWNSAKEVTLNNGCFGLMFIEDISKIKIKAEEGAKGTYQLKLTTHKGDFSYSLKQGDQIDCFIELIKSKLLKLTQTWTTSENDSDICEGPILKKSFCLGDWTSHYMFISDCGMIISKERENNHHELLLHSIKQLWTRFELINNEAYIIFKCKSALLKHEIAVPVENAAKWMKALCSLMHYE